MTIPRSTPLHGTGHTVGEILDAASYTLPVATGSVLGGVKIGDGVTSAEDGTISVAGGGSGTGFTLNEAGDKLAVIGEPGTADRSGQTVLIRSGQDGNTGQQGAGNVTLWAGDDQAGGGPGGIDLIAGVANTAGLWGGNIALTTGGAGNDGTGGAILMETAQGTGAGNRGGEFRITLGAPHSGADTGLLTIINLVTSDPHVANALWNDSGTLKISAG